MNLFKVPFQRSDTMVIELELLHTRDIKGLQYTEDTFKIIGLHTKKCYLYSNLEYLVKRKPPFGDCFSPFLGISGQNLHILWT